MHISTLVYFLTETLKWQVLWGKVKKKQTLVSSRNAGDEKNLHPGSGRFIFLNPFSRYILFSFLVFFAFFEFVFFLLVCFLKLNIYNLITLNYVGGWVILKKLVYVSTYACPIRDFSKHFLQLVKSNKNWILNWVIELDLLMFFFFIFCFWNTVESFSILFTYSSNSLV